MAAWMGTSVGAMVRLAVGLANSKYKESGGGWWQWCRIQAPVR
jgi:hypothetical protein